MTDIDTYKYSKAGIRRIRQPDPADRPGIEKPAADIIRQKKQRSAGQTQDSGNGESAYDLPPFLCDTQTLPASANGHAAGQGGSDENKR